MPALAPTLRSVFGVQMSPVGQVVEEASGVLVTEDELVRNVEVRDVEVREAGLEVEEV